MSMATILRIPEWENATDGLVPMAGSWQNQHGEVLVLQKGATFPSCRKPAGERACWTLIKTGGSV